MESQHYFKIFYGTMYALSVVAHTKWEAIDKAYQKIIADYPTADRSKLRAKKVY